MNNLLHRWIRATRWMPLLLVGSLLGCATTHAVTPSGAQTYYLFVLNESKPGMEEEFNSWYDQQHAQDVLINPEYESSQRYLVNDRQLRVDAVPPTRYAIGFRIETQDIAAALQLIHRNIREGRTVQTNTIALGAGGGGDFTYRALAEVQVARHTPKPGRKEDDKVHYLLMEFAAATPGKEAEFNRWYETQHIAAITAQPGVIQWQRFETSPVQLSNRSMSFATQYLSLYEFAMNDAQFSQLQKLIAAQPLLAPNGSGQIGAGYTYRNFGPRLSGDQVKQDRARR